MRPLWFSLLAVPSLVHTVVTWFLLRAADRWQDATPPCDDHRWLVVVPARNEGRAVARTLQSISDGGGADRVRTLLLLDGDDPDAQEIAESSGCEVVVKRPPGPSKAAALVWLAKYHRETLEEVDAVLLLDVGSTLSPGFFDVFSWPGGVAGVQAVLSGRGAGAGAAAASSETFAQRVEDRGREVLGWTVHLRGTGTALSPDAFRRVAERLRTRVEDTESTLLMAAAGRRVVLGPSAARVHDEKPETVASAARQRARWLAGQLAVPLRHPRAVFRLLKRNPTEGVAFVCDVLGRPLSLTALMRLAVAAVLVGGPVLGHGGRAEIIAAAVIGLSVVVDVAIVARSTSLSVQSVGKLAGSWLVALLLLPLNLVGWQRARPHHRDTDAD